MDQINLIKDRYKWRALVNTGMKLMVQNNAGISWPVEDPASAQDVKFFTDFVTYSFRYLYLTS